MRSDSVEVTLPDAERAIGPDRLRLWIASAVVAVAVGAARTGGRSPRVAFDDDHYVYQNEHVQQGLAPGPVAWAFQLDHPRSYYHPLTWLSLMLDRSVLGPAPWGFHLVNVVLHALVAILLFVVLARATGGIWAPLGAALLFGVHPLTIEAVAWVSERKTVLSGALAMGALLAYTRHAERPSPRRIAAVAVLTFATLLAKPSLVFLPLLLLVLDVWPLRRIDLAARPRAARAFALAVEKWPVALAAAVAIVPHILSFRRFPTTGGGRLDVAQGRERRRLRSPLRVEGGVAGGPVRVSPVPRARAVRRHRRGRIGDRGPHRNRSCGGAPVAVRARRMGVVRDRSRPLARLEAIRPVAGVGEPIRLLPADGPRDRGVVRGRGARQARRPRPARRRGIGDRGGRHPRGRLVRPGRALGTPSRSSLAAPRSSPGATS